MKEWAHRWWPAAPAILILYLGGVSFVEKFPRMTPHRAARPAGSLAPDSLLASIRSVATQASETAGSDTSHQPAARVDPFRPMHKPRPAGVSGRKAVRSVPPPRNFVLKGTVGDNVATISDNSGRGRIVKAGDRIDSAEVVAIEPDKVILRDRAGKFELLFGK